jgi:uncharacterized protein with NAD-binding domain and iron-sulfur cluster
MAKRRIAIIGGGFGGLTAAYELSRTQALRDRYEVTVHQMGWRLGGKCATGRDHQGRILEHGLHFWFGCYDNAWALLKDIYQHWQRPPGCPFQTGLDAFQAQSYTPIGEEIDGRYGFFPVTWPKNSAKRGDGRVSLSLLEMANELAHLIKLLLEGAEGGTTAPGLAEAPLAWQPARVTPTAVLGPTPEALSRARLERALTLLRGAAGEAGEAVATRTKEAGDELIEHLDALRDTFAPEPSLAFAFGLQSHIVRDALHVAFALARGLLSDAVWGGKTLDDLNAIEFRDWLEQHGADSAIVRRSTVVRSIYDTCFWYRDGDPARPDVGTGTALRVILRITTTYKERVMFTLKAGMSEAVVAPLYELLLERGVTVNFFRKLKRLRLDPSRRRIERIELDQQAGIVVGAYRPTRVLDGLVTWPAEPFWDQLVDGEALKQRGVDFESNWCPEPPYGTELLELGHDFDDVVLAVSMGAYKPLALGVGGICDELIAASPKFAQMAEGIGIVPTFAVQYWCTRTTAELGQKEHPATVAGAEALSIWADMSQLLAAEDHQASEPPPKSLHYLCGVLDTKLFREPPSNAAVPARARQLVETTAHAWLDDFGCSIWPKAETPAGDFDHGVIEHSYLRANVDPTECCIGAAAGEVSLRLRTDETGFDNLYLAGCYVRTGLDTTCVESAVMSGMQAARAISGSPKDVFGEHFHPFTLP